MAISGKHRSPGILAMIGLVAAVIVAILLIGVFTGYDATVYEDTPDVPPRQR